MIRAEFESLMDTEGWSPEQRFQWRRITPLCDVETFRREMCRPDGVIWFKQEETGAIIRRVWKRVWDRAWDKTDA
jgi:hypothetical protein